MPKLLCAPASPYSAKIRMAATHAGIPFEMVLVDTGPQPEALTRINPLGKIPTWVTDEDRAVHDSRVITQYLNRQSGGKLFPRNPAKRLEAEQLEALADGICDAALAHVYERRMRPEGKVHEGWLDRQWTKVVRTLDFLCAETPNLPQRIHVGHMAVRAAIGYLDLRFGGKWERSHTKLKRWAARFDKKFPELAKLVPS